MNPQCAKCEKTVYPMEKLNCLDKYWHKSCFKCEFCNLKLTMKNYKGYNKLPYCATHYPTTKFTVVADTPENKRLQQNTSMQSNIIYHKEFEGQKGQFTAVDDSGKQDFTEQLQQAQVDPPQPETVQLIRSQAPAPEPEPTQEMLQQSAEDDAIYRALYDYAASDNDEVSFNEGDIITDCEIIDDAWLTGTVMSTGEHGMMPSNYLEKL
ncbi:LIM and SH3 domain protein F42H10.3,LIM and SH3 domain protein 1,LIM and SH3 domain protein Lasp [Mytilus coruscus]|uniref:LIM and SH3 domain protein F42H10.3,LIM and SH3 domain protein 1,LIM and SH3 domain protein Lasp n=1 Tax=Mytilus coruscus TaxID=42192 RepID=A0A6J8ELQ4_MYTCO|nr:LIM and SH3 domain protein F42H10.3,LIM and SH3 domain protein 1,LIM and SH3 domain protein Lasp [Mytilus coruscus]